MPIERAGSASALIAALRAEMSQRKERAGGAATPGSGPAQPAMSARDPKVLRQQLADLVAPVALDDPAAIKAVRPQVFRAILLWEFGPQLREHPDWQPMLESITSSLEADTRHQAQFLALIGELKR